MIFPIIMIFACFITGGVLLYIKPRNKAFYKKPQETDPAAVTANEFVNVRDICGNFLYTRDNTVLAYLRIMPISIDLFSKSEKQQIVRQLTADLSTADYPFQLIAVSRPVDISPLLSELSDTLTACSDLKQKELLKQEMSEMSSLAVSGDTVERQFYIKIWEKHTKIRKESCCRGLNIWRDICQTQACVRKYWGGRILSVFATLLTIPHMCIWRIRTPTLLFR